MRVLINLFLRSSVCLRRFRVQFALARLAALKFYTLRFLTEIRTDGQLRTIRPLAFPSSRSVADATEARGEN